jgi:hypothetical protein
VRYKTPNDTLPTVIGNPSQPDYQQDNQDDYTYAPADNQSTRFIQSRQFLLPIDTPG